MQTLIILHGWQSSKEKWHKVKQELEKEKLKVVIPDIPGFKPETELARPWNLNDYVKWFKEFSEKIEEPFFLFGHSFGGRIAIKFAAKYPEKLKGLILCAAAGIRRKKNPFVLTIAKVGKAIFRLPGLKKLYPFCRKVFYFKILRKTDYLKAKGVMKEVFKNVINEDLTLCLSQIKVPTLILWGKEDKMTPVKDAYLMKQEIRNSQLKVFKDVGHSLRRENPKLLVEEITKFIR